MISTKKCTFLKLFYLTISRAIYTRAMKNKNAVALGRKGGNARAKSLTDKERSESARKAVLARWAKAKAKTA